MCSSLTTANFEAVLNSDRSIQMLTHEEKLSANFSWRKFEEVLKLSVAYLQFSIALDLYRYVLVNKSLIIPCSVGLWYLLIEYQF